MLGERAEIGGIRYMTKKDGDTYIFDGFPPSINTHPEILVQCDGSVHNGSAIFGKRLT